MSDFGSQTGADLAADDSLRQLDSLMKGRRKLAGAIEFPERDVICYGCTHTVPDPRVRIVDISQVKAGWIAHGHIQPIRCMCGQVYHLLVHYIPVECVSFPCPSCGSGSKLTTEILNITEAETGYSFVALLKCDVCSKQHRLSKLLRGLSKITKIKVGPTGLEVEVKP
jgi:hypothetical protein